MSTPIPARSPSLCFGSIHITHRLLAADRAALMHPSALVFTSWQLLPSHARQSDTTGMNLPGWWRSDMQMRTVVVTRYKGAADITDSLIISVKKPETGR
jgi:hypothetical protein